MPKVTNFVFCEESSLTNGSPEVLGFKQLLESSQGWFSFSIAFSIVDFSPLDEHSVYVVFSDPKGGKLIETDKFLLEKESDEGNDDSKLVSGLTMGVNFDKVQFEGQGIYQIQLIFDDEPIGEFFIPVVLKEEEVDE